MGGASIRAKINRMVVGITAVALLAAASALFANEVLRLRRTLVNDLSTLARILGTNGASALAFSDGKSAEETLSFLRSIPHVLLADYLTVEGEELAKYNRPGKHEEYEEELAFRAEALGSATPEAHRFRAGRLWLLQRIDVDGQRVGWICIASDLSELWERLGWYGGVVAAVLAGAALLAWVLSARLQGLITRPVFSLLEVSRSVSRDGDNLTAWVSTQAVHGTREGFAQGLKIPQANVRVITEFMGGGFGSKFGPDIQGLLCARLAKAANAPVKLMLDRKEEHLTTGNRPSAFAKVKAGVAADGKLTAFDATTWGTGGAGAGSDYPLPYIYVFPNRKRMHTDVYINSGQQRAMRAPGHPQGCFVTEVLMDELADHVRMDPVEFRLKNLPPLAPNAMWAKYFPMGAERINWKSRHVTGDPTPGPIKRGLGCSANRWGGAGTGARAHCEIGSDGSVVMRCGTQDIGTGNRTIMAMVVAETLGLDVPQVTIELGDSNHPFAPGSGGSTTAAAVMPAMRVTAGKARDALFERIAPQLGVAAADITIGVGNITAGSRTISWREACRMLGTVPVSVDGQWERGLSAGGTSGVQFADVEVDIETGITRVKKIVCVQDCGLIVDLKTAETQCYGGIISGVNYAVFEERILDRNTANMVNPNMEWYHMAGQSDIPEIDVVLVDQPERGVIGIGEPPAVATAAAVANAIRNATGVTLRSIPITPDKLLTELERAGGTN
jgi:xanthine dehydrogenase YagR molybdenum-binding subunit